MNQKGSFPPKSSSMFRWCLKDRSQVVMMMMMIFVSSHLFVCVSPCAELRCETRSEVIRLQTEGGLMAPSLTDRCQVSRWVTVGHWDLRLVFSSQNQCFFFSVQRKMSFCIICVIICVIYHLKPSQPPHCHYFEIDRLTEFVTSNSDEWRLHLWKDYARASKRCLY